MDHSVTSSSSLGTLSILHEPPEVPIPYPLIIPKMERVVMKGSWAGTKEVRSGVSIKLAFGWEMEDEKGWRMLPKMMRA